MRTNDLPQHWRQWIRERTRDRDHPGELNIGDFQSGRSVRLVFPDGSAAFFNYAFAVADEENNELAVFTEHCGYHVFPLHELRYSHLDAVEGEVAKE